MLRDAIVAEARSWIGTPFHHQQRKKGHGVDCAQLVASVGAALGLMPELPSELCRYSRSPNPRHMLKTMQLYLKKVDVHERGDVAIICWRNNIPQHMGILAGEQCETIIHAAESGVIETASSCYLIHSYWRYAGAF